MEPAEYRPDDFSPIITVVSPQVAAMEPAEYRPDDAMRQEKWQTKEGEPQWSRPSIGRMTSPRSSWWLTCASPQWSRPSIGRMTSSRAMRRDGSTCAAMEPAEYRPDDKAVLYGALLIGAAAMEPAEYRPDDGRGPARENTGIPEPQWSRPSIGRMTAGAFFYSGTPAKGPQWSRPSIGRMTGPATTPRRHQNRPQWSRPSIGRMTTATARCS